MINQHFKKDLFFSMVLGILISVTINTALIYYSIHHKPIKKTSFMSSRYHDNACWKQ